VLAGDVLKGVLSCLIGLALSAYFYHGDPADHAGVLAAGAGAVIGHNWPLYFNFKGGKGALTAVAVLFMVDWTMARTVAATLFFLAISYLPVLEKGLYFHLITFLLGP
jgi:glycerol-3-phosphate acyltransferase PlsY